MLKRIVLFGLLVCMSYAHADNYKLGDRLQKSEKPAQTRFKEIGWEALVPPSWDPTKLFKDLDLNGLSDGDPRATKLLERLREEWDKAPANPAVANLPVRLPGFVVPLERTGNKVREFLLVPYFGACIHTPPPPANQIVHVYVDKAWEMKTMDPIWVSGELQIERGDSAMGGSSYRINAVKIEPYAETKR